MGPDNRVRWRCRRGLLELDLLLRRFLQQDYADLSPLQTAAFAALVELEDHDLWLLVTQHAQDTQNESAQVLVLLRRALRQQQAIPS